MQNFDKVDNALLFSLYAERRYPYPNEKDWLNAFTYAKKKVAELDIPKIIDELKVEVHTNSWTRSDDVLFCYSSLLYPYEYKYGYLGDKYLDAIFPKYAERLYFSKDDKTEYINPKYEKWEFVRMPDGTMNYKKPKYEGLDLEDFCAIKTKEMRQIALKNYESYNVDEHINHIAYTHVNRCDIHEEDKLFNKMEGLSSVIWGFKHSYLLEKITSDNYKDLIERNNFKHHVPLLSNDE